MPGEQVFVQTSNEFIGGIRKIARYLLLDGPSFLVPFLLAVLDVLHTGRVDTQHQIQIFGWDGIEILRNVLLRISVGKSAQLSIDGGNLVSGHVRAPTERHVFLGMRHSREASRSFIAAGQIILFQCHYRSQGIAHNHYPQPIVQSGASHVRGLARFRRLAASCQDR